MRLQDMFTSLMPPLSYFKLQELGKEQPGFPEERLDHPPETEHVRPSWMGPMSCFVLGVICTILIGVAISDGTRSNRNMLGRSE